MSLEGSQQKPTGTDVLSSSQRKRGAMMSYAYTIAQIAVNLLYVPLLLGGIGASEYGLYQLVGSVMAYMSIMNTTFSAGTTRFYCEALVQGDTRRMETVLATCRRIYHVMSVVACLVGLIVIPLVAHVYAGVLTPFQITESSVMLAMLISNLMVTMHNTVSVAAINAHERFVFLKSVQLATVIMQPVLIIIAVRFFPYAVSIVAVQLLMGLSCALVQKIYVRNRLHVRVVAHEKDRALLKSLLSFSGAMLLVIIADQVFWKTNQLIVGYFYGTVEVAIYAIAAQVYMTYFPLGTAISSVFMPRLTELYHQSDYRRKASDLLIKVGRLSFFVLFLVLSGFAIFGCEFIALWAGPEYTEAYAIALVIMVPFTIDLIQNLGLTILQVENRYLYRGKVLICMAAINIVAVLFVSPTYGSLGAAFVTGMMMLLGNGVVMNAYYKRQVGLDIAGFWKSILHILIRLLPLCILVGGLNMLTDSHDLNWGVLLAKIGIYTACYAIVAFIFAANEYERGLFTGLLRKMKG